MRVALTGSSGFIGGATERALRAAGHLPLPLSSRNPPELENWFAENRPDALLHVGWYVGADYLESPENEACLAGSRRLFWAARNCAVVIGVGSGFEYGPVNGVRREEQTLDPRTPYALAKVRTWEALRQSPVKRSVWARVFNVFGEGEKAGRLLPRVRVAISRNEPIALAPAVQERDWLDVEDVGSALVCLLEQGNGVYNVCSGRSQTLQQFLHNLGHPELLHFGAWSGQAESQILGDNQRLLALGWRPLRAITPI